MAITKRELEQTAVPTAVRREHEGFQRMLPRLLREYEGEYLALYRGKVIGHNLDESTLAGECYRSLGDVPFYIGHVVREPEVMEFPSPELSA